MRVIKRYANRKLYDAATSKTVTLDDIAQMVREGEEIQVIDASEHDITNKVLAQIFLREDMDTKQVFVKRFLLEGLIKESGDRMESLAKKFLFAGIGFAALTKEKAEKLVDDLVKRGELSEDEGAKFVKDLVIKIEKRSTDFKDQVDKLGKKPTASTNGHEDIDALQKKIDHLTKMVADLQAEKARVQDDAKDKKKANV